AGVRKQASVDRPVSVELLISGTLTEPQLAFNLGLPEINAGGLAASIIQGRLEEVQQDETRLYKQVFGLIVLGRFIPVMGGLGSGNGGFASVNEQINGSVSQVLTQQLSDLTEEYLGGVALSVDLASSNQQQAQASLLADRDVSVGLSKQLFNDRLTVKVGGTTTTEQQSSGDQSIYGEFEVLYELTKSGELMIRIFQTSDRDQVISQINQRQGASLLYEKAFNRIFENERLLTTPANQSDDEDENIPETNQNATPSDESRRRRAKRQ
ncbi:MAG: translocation/assembly module TamB domain-containing protein, partial [Bacteroidota bacterium]